FTYMSVNNRICYTLLVHHARLPCSFALDSAGNNNPARIAMMAMTTNSSIRVNARQRVFRRSMREEQRREFIVRPRGSHALISSEQPEVTSKIREKTNSGGSSPQKRCLAAAASKA